ncbi:hypothetical protein BS17DRAFT_878095 [Gyrodon lividus]|nr:hypothetical protein BS17DRAFT_878095 [Gyrodon lividus]
MPSNLDLADTALSEALKHIHNNRTAASGLLTEAQGNELLDSQEDLSKRQEELVSSRSERWFSWSSAKPTEHLRNCQRLLTHVKATINGNMKANIRGGRASSTPTDRSFSLARASTPQPSIDFHSIRDDMESMAAPPVRPANTDFEAPSAYTSALTDAIDTPLETPAPKPNQFSILQPLLIRAVPPPTTQPRQPSQAPQPASTKWTSQPVIDPSVLAMLSGIHPPAQPLDPQVRKLAAAVAKQALPRKAGGRQWSRYNGYTQMSNCVNMDGHSSAEGLTMNVGGYKNSGSVINKHEIHPIPMQDEQELPE